MEALHNSTILSNGTFIIINGTDIITLEPHRPAAFHVTAWIVISIGLPLTLLAICTLVSLVRDGHAAPIYVINLLVSDLIQFCCMAWEYTSFDLSSSIYDTGVVASLGFMVCIAMERYLVIAYPLWYRFRRNIKASVVISIVVWAFSVILLFFTYLFGFVEQCILFSIVFLLPFPLLIFFLAGTLKALSASISVPPEEKRRIVGALVLVLLNYTLLFLPMITWFLMAATSSTGPNFHPILCIIVLQFKPLVDLVLYVFMRKGAVDKLLACLCRCRMTREQEQGQINTVNGDTTGRVSSV
ncbi:G-protein coupled receptor 4-like [Centroberyx gerrardi]